MCLLASNVGVDGRDEPRLTQLAQHDATEARFSEGGPRVINGSVRAFWKAS